MTAIWCRFLLAIGFLPYLYAFTPSFNPDPRVRPANSRSICSVSFGGPSGDRQIHVDEPSATSARSSRNVGVLRRVRARTTRFAHVQQNSAVQQGWTEIELSDQEIEGLSLGEKLEEGYSVIMMPEAASVQECQSLVNAATRCAAEVERFRDSQELDPAGLTRLPTIAAAKRAKDSNTPCATPLPDTVNALTEVIFKRILTRIEDELPSVSSTLFPGASSICALHKSKELEFTLREPAINVYSAGGDFLPHKDHQALTILLTLSPPDSFSGGGTGFWRPDAAGHLDAKVPSEVLKPPPGTALLFGGHVTHAGMPVKDGTRCVYVASFSEPGGRERRALAAAESRDIYGDLL